MNTFSPLKMFQIAFKTTISISDINSALCIMGCIWVACGYAGMVT